MSQHSPLHMEEYFTPGLKAKPAIFIGSQTSDTIRGNPEEQAWEGFYLGAARPSDVVIVRDFDNEYIEYWKELIGDVHIINITTGDKGEFLTQIILDSPDLQQKIKDTMSPKSRLMVFFPTPLEKQLADVLNVPLHGSHEISSKFGTKSGIRAVAANAGVPMPPGYICHTLDEAKSALDSLGKSFETVVIKHDQSFSGYFSAKVHKKNFDDYIEIINSLCPESFKEGRDVLVIEGWLQSKASLCAHIEIVDSVPVVCAGWEQIIDKDEITYIGAGPLRLSETARNSFLEQIKKLSDELVSEGAHGSFGPDFLITADSEKVVAPDSALLVELNARIPYTAVPLEIIKDVKGTIGSGFLARHVQVKPGTTFGDIKARLLEKNILIEKKSSDAYGVVPYNVGLLPYGIFDVVLIAPSWNQTERLAEVVNSLFPSLTS